MSVESTKQLKLAMSGGSFSERLVRFEQDLSRLMTEIDPELINEHARLALGAPWGLGDSEHFEEPAVFSLLAYGPPGIIALESIAALAETNPNSAGVHAALRALAATALGHETYAAGSVWLAHRYPSLSDSAFERMVAAVEATSTMSDAQTRADEAMRRVVARAKGKPVELGQIFQLLEISFPTEAARIQRWHSDPVSGTDVDEMPSAFGPWRVSGKLGGGGQATAYAVIRDGDAGMTKRALKALHPWTNTSKAASEAEQRGRFQREVNALRDLAATGCPNIVAVLDADLAPREGQPWYVMPCYASTVHREKERFRGQIGSVLGVAEKAAQALAWMHSNEPVRTHRDVHTENIFLDDDGSPVLGDFGLVHIASEDEGGVRTGGREAFGPWRWRPPELHPGSPMQHHPKSDVYLLGGVIYEALTGGDYIEETEHGEHFTHEQADFAIARFTDDPRVPYVNTLLRYMLAREPDARLEARQIIERCRDIREWTPSSPNPVAVPSADALRAAVTRYGGRCEGLRLDAQAKRMLEIAQRVCSKFHQPAATPYEISRRVSAELTRSPRMVGPNEVVSTIRVALTVELNFPQLPELKRASYVEFTSTSDMQWHVAVMAHMTDDYRQVKTFVEGDIGVEACLGEQIGVEVERLESSLVSMLENGLRR